MKLNNYNKTVFLSEGLFSSKNNSMLDAIRKKKHDTKTNKAINKLEKKYNNRFPDEVTELIKSKDPFLFQYKDKDVMILGYENMLNVNEFLDYDFVSMNYVVIGDLSDNDYICYDLEEDKFKLYNLIDEIDVIERETIEGILEEIID
jgi:hypothetical protein